MVAFPELIGMSPKRLIMNVPADANQEYNRVRLSFKHDAVLEAMNVSLSVMGLTLPVQRDRHGYFIEFANEASPFGTVRAYGDNHHWPL